MKLSREVLASVLALNAIFKLIYLYNVTAKK